MSLKPMSPTATVHLFPGLSAELLGLLRQLSPREWERPTACPGWTVKDLTAHLLGGNIGRLSSQRDHFRWFEQGEAITSMADLIAMIDRQNAMWVQAARRISPPLLLEFLAATDQQLYEFFKTLRMDAPSPLAVAWAGETVSTNWFDVGREYTEKWFHQQQIREAVGVEGLVERHWCHPTMEICLRALPYTFRNAPAPENTTLTICIHGKAGGNWSLVWHSDRWELYEGESNTAIAKVEMSVDTAWRLFSKGLEQDALEERIAIDGDVALASHIYQLVAIMA